MQHRLLIIGNTLLSLITAIALLDSRSSFAQPKENAIVNFDLSFSNGGASIWTEENICCFQLKSQKDSNRYIRTIDTLLNYTIQRMEDYTGIKIEPVITNQVKTSRSGKFTGFPDMKIKDAVNLGKYNTMFRVSVNITSIIDPAYHWYHPDVVEATEEISSIINDSNKDQRNNSPVPPNKTDMLIKIEQYDSTGKKVAIYNMNSRMSEISQKEGAKFYITNYKSLNGNNFFAFFIGSLESTLIYGKD